jgi:hypothetical protein
MWVVRCVSVVGLRVGSEVIAVISYDFLCVCCLIEEEELRGVLVGIAENKL